MKLLKRYSNRKVYDPDISNYVNADVMLGYIRQGHVLLVVDHKTNRDVTKQTLANLLVKPNALSLTEVQDIVLKAFPVNQEVV